MRIVCRRLIHRSGNSLHLLNLIHSCARCVCLQAARYEAAVKDVCQAARNDSNMVVRVSFNKSYLGATGRVACNSA